MLKNHKTFGDKMKKLLLLTLMALIALAYPCTASTTSSHSYGLGNLDVERLFETNTGYTGLKLLTGLKGNGYFSISQYTTVDKNNTFLESTISTIAHGNFSGGSCGKNYIVGAAGAVKYKANYIDECTSYGMNNKTFGMSSHVYVEGKLHMGFRSVDPGDPITKTPNVEIREDYEGTVTISNTVVVGSGEFDYLTEP